ncbi:MAG: phosphonate ABC transporter ATP-binding protein [Armatimonadetes bacterium]|nr:phosphonate ABC transporter ATP-binding protein [Armatimonadota bacterium]
MLRIEHLSKTYPNGTRALVDVSIEVPKGQFVSIIGLSGAGKSTFLRCINRLIEPTSGRIWLGDVEVTAAGPAELRLIRRRIGMIFQHFNLVKRSSVITNVLSGRLGYSPTLPSLLYRFRPEDYADARVNLERVGLLEKEKQRADTLSGGQQQRVGIARALMQKPELILADEPVASLDPATAHTVLDQLEQMNKRDGMTVLCNLHFLSLARRYADRVIGLKDGKLVFDGEPEEINETRFKEIYGEDAIQVEIA